MRDGQHGEHERCSQDERSRHVMQGTYSYMLPRLHLLSIFALPHRRITRADAQLLVCDLRSAIKVWYQFYHTLILQPVSGYTVCGRQARPKGHAMYEIVLGWTELNRKLISWSKTTWDATEQLWLNVASACERSKSALATFSQCCLDFVVSVIPYHFDKFLRITVA